MQLKNRIKITLRSFPPGQCPSLLNVEAPELLLQEERQSTLVWPPKAPTAT